MRKDEEDREIENVTFMCELKNLGRILISITVLAHQMGLARARVTGKIYYARF